MQVAKNRELYGLLSALHACPGINAANWLFTPIMVVWPWQPHQDLMARAFSKKGTLNRIWKYIGLFNLCYRLSISLYLFQTSH